MTTEELYDQMQAETKEDSAAQQKRMIPVSEVQPGQWVHHTLTAAGSGWYEVISTCKRFDGWYSIKVNCMSRSGKVFTSGLLYRPNSKVEVANG